MKKAIPLITFILVLVVAYFAWTFYSNHYRDNVQKEGIIFIPREASVQQVIDSIAPYLENTSSFNKLAQKELKGKINAGRYQITKNQSNQNLIDMIARGLQKDFPIRIKTYDNVYQMIGDIAQKTEADSLAFVNAFNRIAREKKLGSAEGLKAYFFANTYNFYWTVTPEKFFEKFEKIYNDFWTEENIQKEKKLGLSRIQVYALASMVLRESGGKTDEQRRIAGLYLNRFEKGMKLQSDPTVIYALNKKNNFQKTINRVYYKDLQVNSPYNTYRYIGFPPGPICIVTKTAVENVLNAEDNNYLYMVADPDRPGYHTFTDNLAAHEAHAKKYRNWLNEHNIK